MARTSWAAAMAGVVAGTAYFRRRRKRRDLVVTLFSEPHFRGASETFAPDGSVYPLSATRLRSVGSVRVRRIEFTFRRASTFTAFLRVVVSPTSDRDSRAEAAGWLGLAALRLLDPSSWRRVRDPAGDRQSWVRLWAVDPNVTAHNGSEPWRDIVEDTADVTAWPTRYVEAGVRNP